MIRENMQNTMNTRFLMGLFAPLLFVACQTISLEETSDAIAVSRTEVAFTADGGTATVPVMSEKPISVDCDQAWCSASVDGDNLKVTVSGNDTGSARMASVTLDNGSRQKVLSVVQGCTVDVVSIKSSVVDGAVEMDSLEETLFVSVSANAPWTATSSSSWIVAAKDEDTGRLKITALTNDGDPREGTVTITASKGSLSESETIRISQISHKDNPYYQMLGNYGLHASDWWFNAERLGFPGTGTHCTIEPNVYRESFIIKDLFVKGTVIEASYDKITRTMSIPTGMLCYQRELSSSETMYYYIVPVNMDVRSFSASIITGTLGTAYSDELDEDAKAILLSGFQKEYPGLGAVGYHVNAVTGSRLWQVFADAFYAEGDMYLVSID